MTTTELWREVMESWDSVTAVDLHQHYGIDVLDPGVPERPWWWLRDRIMGLLDIPTSRLALTILKRAD